MAEIIAITTAKIVTAIAKIVTTTTKTAITIAKIVTATTKIVITTTRTAITTGIAMATHEKEAIEAIIMAIKSLSTKNLITSLITKSL